MVVEHTQLVDNRRGWTGLGASGLDVLPVLATARVRAVSRGKVGQRPLSAVRHHLPDRIAEKRMPVPVAPVNRQLDLVTPKFLAESLNQLP
jgi:hypothetical protein